MHGYKYLDIVTEDVHDIKGYQVSRIFLALFRFLSAHFIYFVLYVAVFQNKIATRSRLLLEVGHGCSCRARLISYHCYAHAISVSWE